jgi:hypothetical protein
VVFPTPDGPQIHNTGRRATGPGYYVG